jgi:ankyrin repeat protein
MTCIDLLGAAGRADLPLLTRLLDSGCDPNTVHPTTGASALYNACFSSSEIRQGVDAVRLLLARGADPNMALTYRSPVDGRVEVGIVPLMVTASVDVIELLLQAGADPAAQTEEGYTVLMRLVGTAPSSGLRMLIAAGADPTVRARDGLSAADLARRKLEWWTRFAPTKQLEHQADLHIILRLLEESANGGAA